MYYVVYDVIMRSICTMVLWHLWRWCMICIFHMYYMYIPYVLYVSLAACHASLVAHKLPYLNVFCKINLSWCNFKLNFNRHSINSIKSHLALNYCSTAHDCSGLVVDCQWPGGLWLDPGADLATWPLWGVLPSVTTTWWPVPAYLFLL